MLNIESLSVRRTLTNAYGRIERIHAFIQGSLAVIRTSVRRVQAIDFNPCYHPVRAQQFKNGTRAIPEAGPYDKHFDRSW